MAMYIKKVKRVCDVRGCKNTDCYALSRSHEFGNSVIICKSCMGSALTLLDEINPETGTNIPPVGNKDAPPLFYLDAALPIEKEKKEPAANDEPEKEEPEKEDAAEEPETVEKAAEDATEGFVCPDCGKFYGSRSALNKHIRNHHAKDGEDA